MNFWNIFYLKNICMIDLNNFLSGSGIDNQDRIPELMHCCGGEGNKRAVWMQRISWWYLISTAAWSDRDISHYSAPPRRLKISLRLNSLSPRRRERWGVLWWSVGGGGGVEVPGLPTGHGDRLGTVWSLQCPHTARQTNMTEPRSNNQPQSHN